MKKALPCQEKVPFFVPKGERILKNPFRIAIFPVNLNGDSEAFGILHLELGSANESGGGGRGPYIEFLPGHLIWDSLHIPDEEKYRLEHPWKDKVFYVEWRTKDQSNVKVYDQKKIVDYADYKVGLFYISPFDLFVEGEAVITKMEKKKSS
jgi:hypothetical protein